MPPILKNAELRGEIRLEKLSPRNISPPLAPLQYELITKLHPVSGEAAILLRRLYSAEISVDIIRRNMHLFTKPHLFHDS